MNKSKNSRKLYTVTEAIAHTDKTIEIAADRLQQKVRVYSISRIQNENSLVSRQ